MCTNTFTTIADVINYLMCTLMRSVVPLLITVAVVAFIWGVIQAFINPDNEEARKKGKSYMMWGIVALFVITTIWGLVGILSDTFGLGTPLIPQLSNTK